MYLENYELASIYGGVSITATLLNAIARVSSTVYNIGVAIGSTIRRLINGNVCKA